MRVDDVRSDLKPRFDSVMLYGNELCLIVFELLLLCTTDLLAKCFATDAVVTYVVIEVSDRHA